jgi:hypothetical protein
MTTLMILLAVAAVLSIVAIRDAIQDGRGPQRPPTSHFEDPQFQPPAAAGRRSEQPELLTTGLTDQRRGG